MNGPIYFVLDIGRSYRDPLMLQPTWTIVMAIDLCDGRKYFVEL
jgi:hypothetical protein